MTVNMALEAIQSEIEKLVNLYASEVLTARTRSVDLLGRKCVPQLMYTFLGFEVKLGRKRITCPDITTARYIKIFGEIGLKEVEIPYDPTVTARLVPRFETAFFEIKRLLLTQEHDEKNHRRALRRLYAGIRLKLQGQTKHPAE